MTGKAATHSPNWNIRLACDADIPALEELIPRSVRELQRADYSEAANGSGARFGFRCRSTAHSRRDLLRGRTRRHHCRLRRLEPAPKTFWQRCHRPKRRSVTRSEARCGAYSRVLCSSGIRASRDCARNPAGSAKERCARKISRAAEMVATLSGEPFYAAFGYSACERYQVPLTNDLTLPVVRMTKQL